MKTKKSRKANIERLRSLFIQTGFILALSVTLIAFEWNTVPGGGSRPVYSDMHTGFEEEVINTFTEKKEVRPPEPRPAEILEIIAAEDPCLEELIPFSTEVTQQTPVFLELPETAPENAEPDFFIAAEVMPSFRGGGLERFIEWVYATIRYPEVAISNQVQGKVIVQFIVERDGGIRDIRVLRSDDPSFTEEVLRVISSSPEWQPGMQSGKPVRVSFQFPVKFVLK